MADANGRTRRHRTWLVTTGTPGNLRFLAQCSCGWKTGPMLTTMQAQYAAKEHDGGA